MELPIVSVFLCFNIFNAIDITLLRCKNGKSLDMHWICRKTHPPLDYIIHDVVDIRVHNVVAFTILPNMPLVNWWLSSIDSIKIIHTLDEAHIHGVINQSDNIYHGGQ